MVNINEEYPSKFLKSADLQGHAVKVKVKDVTVEQIGNDRKLIMYFAGKAKGMVLNKTNARTIGDVFGEDTDAWVGREIEVFAMKVDFQGRMVDGLRVRVLPQSPPSRAHPQSNHAPPPPDDGYRGDDFNDEVPFAPEWR